MPMAAAVHTEEWNRAGKGRGGGRGGGGRGLASARLLIVSPLLFLFFFVFFATEVIEVIRVECGDFRDPLANIPRRRPPLLELLLRRLWSLPPLPLFAVAVQPCVQPPPRAPRPRAANGARAVFLLLCSRSLVASRSRKKEQKAELAGLERVLSH